MKTIEIQVDSDDPNIIFQFASIIKKEVAKLDLEVTFNNMKFDIDIDTKKVSKNIELLNQGKLDLNKLDL